MNRQTNSPAEEKPAPLCSTCHKPIEANHVCQLADLPRGLRAVVEAVLEQAVTVVAQESEVAAAMRKAEESAGGRAGLRATNRPSLSTRPLTQPG